MHEDPQHSTPALLMAVLCMLSMPMLYRLEVRPPGHATR
jgi:hypothetical protein